MPPPAPAAPGKGPVKGKFPPWVWIAAIAGGLVIGFVFLKKPGSGDTASGEGSGGAAAQPSGGATVVQPLDDQLAEALGLKPPRDSGGYQGGGDSGGGDGGGDSSGGDSGGDSSFASNLSTLQGSGLSPAQSSPQTGIVSGPSSVQTTYQGPALGIGPKVSVIGGGSANFKAA